MQIMDLKKQAGLCLKFAGARIYLPHTRHIFLRHDGREVFYIINVHHNTFLRRPVEPKFKPKRVE